MLDSLLPISTLPKSGKPESEQQRWYGMDSLESYRKQGGHPLYSETDITYAYNSFGYRCPEFDAVADIRMISIGCSRTFGVGLPQQALYHELFAARLRTELGKSVVNWNLAMPGSSCDYVSRMLHLAVPILKPNIVLIQFPHSSRREYITVQGKRFHYIPNFIANDPVSREIGEHFAALSSNLDDQVNFYRNYKSVESLFQNRFYLFTPTNPWELEELRPHLDVRHQFVWGRVVDRARDNMHPGPSSHQAVSENCWSTFILSDGPERLTGQK